MRFKCNLYILRTLDGEGQQSPDHKIHLLKSMFSTEIEKKRYES